MAYINLSENPNEVFMLPINEVTNEILESMRGYVSNKFINNIRLICKL